MVKITNFKTTGYLGLLTLLCLSSGIIYAWINFPQNYSPLNYFISELGNEGEFMQARGFNFMLMLSGGIMGLFMFQLSQLLQTKRATSAGLLGVISGISAIGVGIIYMGKAHHTFFAFAQFISFFFATIRFQPDIFQKLVDKGNKGIRWIMKTIVWLMGSTFIVLLHEYDTGIIHAIFSQEIARPDFWLLTVMEWLLLILMCLWVLIISFYLLCAEKGRNDE